MTQEPCGDSVLVEVRPDIAVPSSMGKQALCQIPYSRCFQAVQDLTYETHG